MATKPASDTSTHLAFLLSTFSHGEGDIRIDWNKVALDNGIGYGRNASTKFKDTLKKYGYKFENNKISKIGDEDGTSVASAPATPKVKTPRAKKTPTKQNGAGSVKKASTKKRKLDLVIDGEEEDEAQIEETETAVQAGYDGTDGDGDEVVD